MLIVEPFTLIQLLFGLFCCAGVAVASIMITGAIYGLE